MKMYTLVIVIILLSVCIVAVLLLGHPPQTDSVPIYGRIVATATNWDGSVTTIEWADGTRMRYRGKWVNVEIRSDIRIIYRNSVTED